MKLTEACLTPLKSMKSRLAKLSHIDSHAAFKLKIDLDKKLCSNPETVQYPSPNQELFAFLDVAIERRCHYSSLFLVVKVLICRIDIDKVERLKSVQDSIEYILNPYFFFTLL